MVRAATGGEERATEPERRVPGAPSTSNPPAPPIISTDESPSEQEVVSMLVTGDELTLPVLAKAVAYWMTRRRAAFLVIMAILLSGIAFGASQCGGSEESAPEASEAGELTGAEETQTPSASPDETPVAEEREAAPPQEVGEQAPAAAEEQGIAAEPESAGETGEELPTEVDGEEPAEVAPATGNRRPRRPPRRRRRVPDRPPANPF